MITISGVSDDLIEIDGEIEAEFYLPSSDYALLAFNTGDLLRIQYTESGVWRIQPILAPSLVRLTQCPEGDENNYSDVAVLNGDVPFNSVVMGTEMARA